MSDGPSAGRLCDRALTSVLRSGGDLGRMVVKRKIIRADLDDVIERLEAALVDLKRARGD